MTPTYPVEFSKLLRHAKEFPELERLRLNALRVAEKKPGNKGRWKQTRWMLLKMVLWKNLIIRKRRKSQFFLLLFQIFLWFSIACFSIAARNTRIEYPEEPYDGPTQLVPRVHPTDLNVPVGVSFNADLDQPVAGGARDHSSPFRKNFVDILEGVSSYYDLTYEGRHPPLHLFDSHASLLRNMRSDKRIPYGIHFDQLDIDHQKVHVKLVFWEKEVPVSFEFNPFNCRERAVHNVWDAPCEMKLYGQHGFTFIQTALATSLADVLARIHGLMNASVFQAEPADAATMGGLQPVDPPNRYRLELPGIGIVAERYPEYHMVRSFAAEIAPSTPFYFMFALVSVFSFVVMDMVGEKESRMKEVMKTYGLSSTMFWTSWLLTYAILDLIIVWCAVFICTIGGVFGPVTSIVVVAVLFYVYLLSLITMGFVISVFFHRAQTATLAAMIFNLFLYALGWVLHHARVANALVRATLMLFSTVTFSLALIDLIGMLPDQGVRLVDLFNFSQHRIGVYFLVLIWDTALYFFLAWYLDQVTQSDWGSAKDWTFVFRRLNNWLNRKLKTPAFLGSRAEARGLLMKEEEEEDQLTVEEVDWVEQVPRELLQRGPAVRIRGLVKRFPGAKGVKTAVDGLNLDMYPGEIFGLLGHNGAGKTTTISMLTGMLAVDEGDAEILGHSIRTDQESARKLISVCPQNNLFFEDLTCLEHMVFFAALRGMDVTEGMEQAENPAFFSDVIVQKRFLLEQRGRIVDAIVNAKGATEAIHRSGLVEMEKHFQRFGLSLFTDPDIHYVHGQGRTVVAADTWPGVLAAVEKVGLSEKLFSFPRMLSGGMKRRLWLTIALIGDPKVVFLDEPTSGVDPLGRQELWRQIQDEKIAGRCIIITTHHMEEADILADRKAVMTTGKLRCVGSSLFLKSRFGIGYYLECSIAHGTTATETEAAAEAILALIRKHVPEAQRHHDTARGPAAAMAATRRRILLFSLPLASLQHFPALFTDMEEHKTALGIENYGGSLSTLEEVFFKLGEEEKLDAQTRGDGTARPSLQPLEALGTRRRGSVLPILDQEAVVAERRVSADPDARPPLKRGVRGDLVSQRFRPSDVSVPSFWKVLYAVVILRFLQIIHNKITFVIDVIFPVLMLMASLFFREGGASSLVSLISQETTLIPVTNPTSTFNSTILYAVDPRLTGQGLADVYGFLKHLPPEIKALLKRVDVITTEFSGSGTDDTSAGADPTVAFARGGPTDPLLPDSAWRVEAVPLDVGQFKAPMHGRAVRNYLFSKRRQHEKAAADGGGPPPTYSAGLSFEPWTESADFGTPGRAMPYLDSYRLQVRIFYDAGLPHALPVMLSLLNEAYFASRFPRPKEENSSGVEPRLRLDSTPLLLETPVYITAITYPMYVMLTLGLSSLPSRFGTQIMLDKFIGTKHAMIVMGLPFSVYWMGTFLCNYIAMLFGNYVVCAFIAYFVPYFWSFAIVPVLACAACFSASVLLWSYFLSQLFRNMKAYAIAVQLTSMFLALIPAYIVSVFSDAATSGAKWGNAMLVSHIIFSFIFPPYNPIGVLIGCCVVVSDAAMIHRLPRLIDYFRLENLPIWSVLGSAFQAIVLFVTIVLIDRRHYHGKTPSRATQSTLEAYYRRRDIRRMEWLERRGGNQNLIPTSLRNLKDQDVLGEEFECAKIRKVLDGQLSKYSQAKTAQDKEEHSSLFEMAAAEDPCFPDELPLVLIDDLHYMFMPLTENQLPHAAVRGFSLSIYRGEIFGLLGPNGAGKTTSINLLTCNYMIEAPTKGVALMGGHDVARNPTAAFTHLGLCPQFDALWGDVPVRDNLKVFARIKNVPERELNAVVDKYIEDLELQDHQYKRLGECSGGNKRRVSVAVAFLGDPDVVLMDEPSSGIDPIGRRRLAELVHRNAASRCVLITTHSMEEAEALCSRVGIIVNGELNCLNTSLAIRNQYGSGLRLEVIFDEEDPLYIGFDPTGKTLNPWQQFLRDTIHAEASEVHRVANRVTYDIPLKSNSLGLLFGRMEEHKREYAIKEYALCQPTLEQVFISFAKAQKSAQETMQEIFRV